MAAGVVAAAQVGKSAAGLPVLQAEFDLSLTAAAWYLSVISLVGAVGGAGLGWLGQSIGFRRQVQAGLLLILLMNLAGAAAQGATALMATRVGEGLGFALVVLAAPGLLTTVTGPANRRFVVGAWGAYMPIGAGLGTLLVPLVLLLMGWRGVWIMAAAFTAAALVAVTRSVAAAPGKATARLGSFRGALGSRGVLCLTGVFAAYAGQYLAVLGLLPTMLVGDGRISVLTAGVVTGIAFILNAPGNIIGAVLQQRGVPRHLLIIGGSLCMGASVWMLHAEGMPMSARIAAAGIFSFTAGVVPSAAFGGVAALTAGTDSIGPAMGLLMQGSSLGQLLVPPLVAASVTYSGIAAGGAAPLVLSGLAALAVLGGVLYRHVEIPVRR